MENCVLNMCVEMCVCVCFILFYQEGESSSSPVFLRVFIEILTQ